MTNTTMYKAPSLQFRSEKDQDNKTNQIYMIPQRLADIIFNVLGNSSAQIKIMMVLCGTKEGFFISGKWMRGRTGLSPQSYSAALKKLVKRGWVSHRNYQTIRVNFDKIYEDGREYDKNMQDAQSTSDSSRSMPDEDCYSTSD